jgi:hypothetical protein
MLNIKETLELIQNAFCWEGYARAEVLPTSTETQIHLTVTGVSSVEHSGDESGIRDQVSDLRGEVITEDGFEYIVMSSSCRVVRTAFSDGEGDYEVMVTGAVTLSRVKA